MPREWKIQRFEFGVGLPAAVYTANGDLLLERGVIFSKPLLDAFTAEPEKYAPQYGGYCAWAVSQGYTAKTDPRAFSLIDGKLYLNYSRGVQATWAKDLAGNISRGDANWPKVLE